MNEKRKKIDTAVRDGFERIVSENNLDACRITISGRGLSPEEAIGNTVRKDYPIQTGKEKMLQAECLGSFGQSFTDAPSDFEGTLEDVMALDMENDPHARGLYFAAMNAVMRHLGLIDHTVHCRNEGPVKCSKVCLARLKKLYSGKKIALVGYQPSLFQALAGEFELRVLDLNPLNVGNVRFGVRVEHGIDDYESVVKWADLILCTGSVFCNGTMDKYIDIEKPVIFFGISSAGAGCILGLERMCPESE